MNVAYRRRDVPAVSRADWEAIVNGRPSWSYDEAPWSGSGVLGGVLGEIAVVQEQEAIRKLMGAVDESGRGARNAIGCFISSCLDLDKYSVIPQSTFRLWSVR